MIPKFSWNLVSREYVTYLAHYDKNIPNSNSPTPLIGVTTIIGNYQYFLPVSSVKEKYFKMTERPDFIRLTDNGILLSAINLNNMFPVSNELIIPFKYDEVNNYFHFSNTGNMIALFKKELSIINKKRDEIVERANILYETKFDIPHSKVSERCCNFDMLEEKCIEYQRVNRILPECRFIGTKSNLYHIYDNLSNQDDFEKVVALLDTPVRSNMIKQLSSEELDDVVSRSIEQTKE